MIYCMYPASICLPKHSRPAVSERYTMVFSSLFFVFAFLVLCYGIYLMMPSVRAKNAVLLVFSLIFYAWGGPPLVLLLCLETFICYIGGLLIGDARPSVMREGGNPRRAKFYMAVTVGMCLAILGIYKYTGFFADTLTGIFGLDNVLPAVALPIGISFYTFQLISYVVDVYRGETLPQRNYGKLLLYAALFHQCIAGPIVRYVDVERELNRRTMNLNETWRGMMRFTIGLGKKAILANTCAVVADSLLGADKLAAGAVSSLSVILGVSAYMLQIYLDFSAYSDMAIGMGWMIGFHFKENFNHPYAATSITDFWRRWHISLSSFFRDYVYIPLGGNRCSKGRHILNLLIVWALTGFWHGASWNFVLWGLYFALFLVLEKYVFKWGMKPVRIGTSILRRVYTLAVVWFGWFLFRFDDMSVMGDALTCLFGFGKGFGDMTARITFLNYLFILAISVVACTPVVPFLRDKLSAAITAEGTPPVARATARGLLNVVAVAAPVVLLCLSILAMVGDNYNPFLYFRF